jgi:hypothetical protein
MFSIYFPNCRDGKRESMVALLHILGCKRRLCAGWKGKYEKGIRRREENQKNRKDNENLLSVVKFTKEFRLL